MRRVLVFDLGGVLIRLKDPSLFTDWLAARCRRDSLNGQWLEAASDKIQSGEWTARKLYSELRSIGDLKADWKGFHEAFCGLILDEETPGASEMLGDLSRTHRLVMLSNTNEEHIRWQKRRTPRLFARFDALYYSHRLRCVKPGERIFREVMKRERAEPGCFTLLDDTAENIVTARILGWRTVKVERNRFEPEKLSVEG